MSIKWPIQFEHPLGMCEGCDAEALAAGLAKKCETCNGNGVLYEEIPPGTLDWEADCETCNGLGMVPVLGDLPKHDPLKGRRKPN